MPKKGMDLSAWQGKIPARVFEQNKAEIPYVILRCSYTSLSEFALHEDSVFEHNIKTASKAGMKIGVYHYSQATSETEAIKEAKFVLKTIKPYHDKINTRLVAFDWEFGKRLNSSVARKLGKQRCKQIIDAFCRVIQNAGYTPMLYANLSTLNGYIASNVYRDVLIWVAQYHSRCDYKHPYAMWQYTSSGSAKGIKGRVDLNYVYFQESASVPEKTERYAYDLPKLPSRGWFTSGDTGEEVKKVQRFVKWYTQNNLTIDGIYGRKTMEAVRNFQGREKLAVDGLFGKECLTRAKTVKR